MSEEFDLSECKATMFDSGTIYQPYIEVRLDPNPGWKDIIIMDIHDVRKLLGHMENMNKKHKSEADKIDEEQEKKP